MEICNFFSLFLIKIEATSLWVMEVMCDVGFMDWNMYDTNGRYFSSSLCWLVFVSKEIKDFFRDLLAHNFHHNLMRQSEKYHVPWCNEINNFKW